MRPHPARLAAAAFAMVCTFTAMTATAADFRPGRGISMDQWITWPGPERWNEAELLDNFPQWRAFVTERDLDQLAASGMDTVRLPIDPAMFLHEIEPARWTRLFAGVDAAIDRLNAAGMKVVVDLHTIPRDDGAGAPGTAQILRDDALFAAYAGLVTETAWRLRDRPTTQVALEIFNEPVGDCDDQAGIAAWQNALVDLHRAARKLNPDITLILPGPCWASAEGLAMMDPAQIGDPNTVWTFHHYDPFKLTHQSATWAGPEVRELAGIPYPPGSLDAAARENLIKTNERLVLANMDGENGRRIAGAVRADIEQLQSPEAVAAAMRQPFRTAAAWADRNGIARDRIYLGEFGMIRQEYDKDPPVAPQWRVAYMRDMIALAEEQGFGWTLWSFGGAFGLMQGFGGEPMVPDLVSPVMAGAD